MVSLGGRGRCGRTARTCPACTRSGDERSDGIEVRAGWEQASQAFSHGRVALDDLVVPIADDAAYTLGTEHCRAKLGGESVGIDWRVTNIYRREGGEWEVVHHH